MTTIDDKIEIHRFECDESLSRRFVKIPGFWEITAAAFLLIGAVSATLFAYWQDSSLSRERTSRVETVSGENYKRLDRLENLMERVLAYQDSLHMQGQKVLWKLEVIQYDITKAK